MHSGQIFMIVIVGLITACVTLTMFAQAWAESRKRTGGVNSPLRLDAIEARLVRMEETIDSVAVEMERIAEGQRFTAKLLAERASPAAPAPVPRDSRYVTPH